MNLLDKSKNHSKIWLVLKVIDMSTKHIF